MEKEKKSGSNSFWMLSSIIISLFAFLVRVMVSLHPYSGEGNPPMYGDFEAQRHWMEITINTPTRDWYHNTTSNNLSYWGLDYPPLTAYRSYVIYVHGLLFLRPFDPDSVSLLTFRGHESPLRVGFYQMAKIAVTPTIVIAEFLLFRKKVSFHKVLALAAVSIGVAVATVTDLQFNLFGACIALAWKIPSAVNKILWSNLQQKSNWTALALMWKTTPVTIPFLLALMPFLDPPGISSFNWDLHNTSAILVSAVLGFLLQWSGFLALGATSATTHIILGQFKTCVIMLGGYLIFGSDPGFVSVCGAIGALCGMSVYTSLNMKESKETASKQLPKQTTKPIGTVNSVEKTDMSNINNAEESV